MTEGLYGLNFGVDGAGDLAGEPEGMGDPRGGGADEHREPENHLNNPAHEHDANVDGISQLEKLMKGVATLKARLALQEAVQSGEGAGIFPPPPALFVDPASLERIRAATVTARGEDKKVEVPRLVPRFKASMLGIGKPFDSPHEWCNQAAGVCYLLQGRQQISFGDWRCGGVAIGYERGAIGSVLMYMAIGLDYTCGR